MTKFTEDSPEVVLAAAYRSPDAPHNTPAHVAEDMSLYPRYRECWTRVVEAARKLAAEGKLGPTQGVEAFRAKVLEYLERAAADGERLARDLDDNRYGERAYAFRLAAAKVRDMDAGEQRNTGMTTEVEWRVNVINAIVDTGLLGPVKARDLLLALIAAGYVTQPKSDAQPSTLVEAAAKARDLFQWYADEHTAAGKTEKAKRNQDAADMLTAALTPPSKPRSTI